MALVTTGDGTEIFYKDWGSGQPIVFHHGWPLSSEPSIGLLKDGTLEVYPGFPHGMCTTHADVINQDLLEFIAG